MRRSVLALLAAASLSLPTGAAAESFTTKELLRIAEEGDAVDQLFLVSYTVGLAQGVEMSHQASNTAGLAFFCPQESLSFGQELVMSILREQVAHYPQSAEMEPRVVFFNGLVSRYPCEEERLGQLGRER
jgi:hypothetical protein